MTLWPIAVIGVMVAGSGLELCLDVAALLGWDEAEDAGFDPGPAGLEIALDLAVLIVMSVVLRWLVRRWVVDQPPDPPRT